MSLIPRWLLLILCCGFATSTLGAQICDASAFGPVQQDPITIPSGTHVIGNLCTLDFGSRHVILEGTLEVETVFILAGKMTIANNGKIQGQNGQTTEITITRTPAHPADLIVSGKIQQNDSFGGGTITISADGEVRLEGSGQIEARGIQTSDADGGSIDITSGKDMLLDGAATTLNASGHGIDSAGGDVTLYAIKGDISILQNVDVSGKAFDGGTVDICLDTGSIVIGAVIDCNATSDGSGGSVTVDAWRDVTVLGNIHCSGGTGTQSYGGGDGGDIDLTAGRDMQIAANLRSEGGIFGSGGTISFDCGRDFHQSSGLVAAFATALEGFGGSVSVLAGGQCTLEGNVDARGDAADFSFGGGIDIDSCGPLSVSGDLVVDANVGGTVLLTSRDSDVIVTGTIQSRGLNGGTGGGITLRPFAAADLRGGKLEVHGNGTLGVGGTIDVLAGFDVLADGATRVVASGNGTGGGTTAGSITVEGCRVDFPAQSRIHARSNGSGGSIKIKAGDVLSLGGQVMADSGSGTIELTTRIDAPFSPILTGATITPPTNVVHDPTLSPCLARKTTTLTATPEVSVGLSQRATISLQSVGNAPVIVLLDFATSYASLGALGYTQIDPMSAIRLADFGYYGPQIPGSRTSASGRWSFLSNPITSPGLIGRTAYIEAFVVDNQAENGSFHQPPLATIEFKP